MGAGGCWLISNEDKEKVAENSPSPAQVSRDPLGVGLPSPHSHPLATSIGRRFLRQHDSRPSYTGAALTICWASPCCLENHFPKPPPSISGALSADGHIPSTGAHDADVPRANPSLARPEQRRSPRTRCGDGAAHAAEIPSHAFAASLGASLSPAPRRGNGGGAAGGGAAFPLGHGMETWALQAVREGNIYG